MHFLIIYRIVLMLDEFNFDTLRELQIISKVTEAKNFYTYVFKLLIHLIFFS